MDRAKVRTTLSYAVTPDLQVGLELNPLAPDIGPIANWRAMPETERRPSLILGTSSDRIGTPHGRAFYATLSKDLENWTGLPVAPYAGLAFGTFDDELVPIAGLVVRWFDKWSTIHLYDGQNLHHLLTAELNAGRSLSLVVAQQDEEHYLGLSLGLSFGE